MGFNYSTTKDASVITAVKGLCSVRGCAVNHTEPGKVVSFSVLFMESTPPKKILIFFYQYINCGFNTFLAPSVRSV